MKKYLYKFAIYPIKFYWFIFRPSGFGVKCVIYKGSEVLMIKNTYGRGWWTFPGGGIKKGESEENAARREVSEEVGLELKNLKLVGKFLSTLEYKKDNITVFSAEPETLTINLQEAEIQEAKWFSMNALPAQMATIAKRALSLWVDQKL